MLQWWNHEAIVSYVEAREMAKKNYIKLVHPCICQVCGKDYLGRLADSIFCSNACKHQSLVVPIEQSEVSKALELYQSGLTWQKVDKTMGITPYRRRQLVEIIRSQSAFKCRSGKKLNQTGENNDNWKGGRTKMSGYVAVKAPAHPRGAGGNRGYVMEHILVMEEYIGRYLVWQGRQHPDNEIVHHINGIRDDNRLENLVLMLSREHSYLHGNQKWARDILDSTNNVIYSNLKEASATADLNENELATYIHFGWKRKGIVWQYATGRPITALALES